MLVSFAPAAAQPSGIGERAFFYNDIYHFVGHPYKSPAFGEIKTFAQPFTAKCSGLNRIIVSFYVSEAGTGNLKFNLYRFGRDKTPLFSTDIDIGRWPPPDFIGSHAVKGVLHYLWIPEQTDSKNKTYLWEITGDLKKAHSRAGIYLTRTSNPQLQPILVDGISQPGSYAAFYAYCQYRFEWAEIIETTWSRLWQQKYFMFFYLLMLVGVGAGIRRNQTPAKNVWD